MTPLPMFPLGTVLFPHAFLPLHVFEERYHRLVHDCLAGDARFGVTLIERGSEVGGGDRRTMLGTVAVITDAVEMADGRWALGAVGSERFVVEEWLVDDPYPRAEVQPLPEPAWESAWEEAFVSAARSVRRASALLTELGEPAAPVAVPVSPDRSVAVWQLAALAPLGPFDRQRILSIPDPLPRLTLLQEAVEDTCSVLAQRLAQG